MYYKRIHLASLFVLVIITLALDASPLSVNPCSFSVGRGIQYNSKQPNHFKEQPKCLEKMPHLINRVKSSLFLFDE